MRTFADSREKGQVRLHEIKRKEKKLKRKRGGRGTAGLPFSNQGMAMGEKHAEPGSLKYYAPQSSDPPF